MNLREKATELGVYPRRADKAHLNVPVYTLLGAGSVTLVLWITSLNQVSLVQGFVAFLLLLLAWWSYSSWQRTGCRGLPLFTAITSMYWLYFALPLFWGDRMALDWRTDRLVSDEAVTRTMLLVAFGIIFLRLGMESQFGREWALKRLPELSRKDLTIGYVQFIAVGGTLLGASTSLAFAFGEGLRQIVEILESTVPIAAIAILLGRVLEGKRSLFEKGVLFGVIALRVVLGLSGGWMGKNVFLALVCGLVYLQKKNKLPVMALLVVPYVLFFQVGKTEFRSRFWYSGVESTNIERLDFWLGASMQKWTAALNDPSGRGVPLMAAASLARTSLLNQAADVLDQTPLRVPYQYGRLYSYLAVALVPRFFWPDKPSMNDANQFYQVAYGITPERNLTHFSAAVGTLTEGYINFGWFGTAMVMFLVGILLDFWNASFFEGRTVLAAAVGTALLPQLLTVEYQLAQYLSGVVQHLLLTFLVFLPVLRWKGKMERRSGPLAHAPRMQPRSAAV